MYMHVFVIPGDAFVKLTFAYDNRYLALYCIGVYVLAAFCFLKRSYYTLKKRTDVRDKRNGTDVQTARN